MGTCILEWLTQGLERSMELQLAARCLVGELIHVHSTALSWTTDGLMFGKECESASSLGIQCM